MARISVLMGIYNCASTLDEALESLYAQTYQDFKIILCDDGSTDNTFGVAKRHAATHKNVILIQNEQNKGLNYTLNHCLEYADTEYIARMDGDDISEPTRFAKEIKFLDTHPEYAVVSSPMIYFDEKGEFKRGTRCGEVDKMDFLNGTPICHAPSMSRTNVIKSVGGYTVDIRLLRVEDYHLWFKVYAAGFKLFRLEECLYSMRDDRKAFRRRNWVTRKNECYVKHIGYKLINMPFYYQIFALVPIIKYFVPSFIYKYIHKN